jgi:two-component system chemotaxis response regulator CheB
LIKVVVVEDSASIRELMIHVLESSPDIRVVATANDGRAALAAVAQHRPDLVTMDIHMPHMDGIAATRGIMETHPTPIVIVSGSVDRHETDMTFQALDAGALAVLPRPVGPGHSDYQSMAAEMVRTVRLMSEVRVVRRWPRRKQGAPLPLPERLGEETSLVAIGASTGGPPVLQMILAALPRSFPLPILVVQHLAPGFAESFCAWLGSTSKLPVELSRHGTTAADGHVYIAPSGQQMQITAANRILLTDDAPENGLRPSASHLFRSLLERRSRTVAVLLTGMGRDGAEELKLLRDAGATTLVQSPESCVVAGMPGEAIRLGAAMHVLDPDQIAPTLAALTIHGKETAR